MEWLYPLLLFLLGLFMVAKPEILWKLEHFLTVKDGEPSDLYLALTRIGGALIMIISIILLVIYIAQQMLG